MRKIASSFLSPNSGEVSLSVVSCVHRGAVISLFLVTTKTKGSLVAKLVPCGKNYNGYPHVLISIRFQELRESLFGNILDSLKFYIKKQG